MCFRLGTRFRPLSLEIPKPLFPIAGYPILHHLIESCVQVGRPWLLFLHLPVASVFSSANFAKFFSWDAINRTKHCHDSSPMLNKHSACPFGTIALCRDWPSSLFHRYLQEYTSLGTGGGIYHFRDLIKSNVSDKDVFFVINGDICADLPLVEMLQFHRETVGEKGFTILGTEVS